MYSTNRNNKTIMKNKLRLSDLVLAFIMMLSILTVTLLILNNL